MRKLPKRGYTTFSSSSSVADVKKEEVRISKRSCPSFHHDSKILALVLCLSNPDPLLKQSCTCDCLCWNALFSSLHSLSCSGYVSQVTGCFHRQESTSHRTNQLPMYVLPQNHIPLLHSAYLCFQDYLPNVCLPAVPH